MGAKITSPYRSDKDHLRDLLRLVETKQELYTLKTRMGDWIGDAFERPADSSDEGELARQARIRRLDGEVRSLERRVAQKSALARAQGAQLSTERMAESHGLCELELRILLVLLLEDISVSGTRTYSRGKDILGLLLDDRMSVLDARRHLYASAPLVSQSLIVCSSPEESSVLDAYFKISERAVRELTGGIADAKQLGERLGLVTEEPHQIGAPALRTPTISLDDVVLPPACRDEVGHLIALSRHSDLLLNSWGFAQSYQREGMTTALFSGPPGTGKTITAQAVAHALGRPILIVSYPEMVSKWVGETEKNIARVFGQAAAHDAVLLFDEADAMFHTRVSVSNATDQSFNREVNVLLQEVERFPGVLVLTTNRVDDLDPAFERRISVRVGFPIPDAAAREEIWRRHVPTSAPLADDVDFEALARAFPFAGGHIKNAVLRAAANAAVRGAGAHARIGMKDFRLAAQREFSTCSAAVSTRRMGLGSAQMAS